MCGNEFFCIFSVAFILSCKRGLARSLKSFYEFDKHEFPFLF